MKITASDIYLSVNFNEAKVELNQIPIFLLHGFTGQGSDWNFLLHRFPKKFLPVTIDIIGHGQSDSPANKNYYFENNLVEQLHSIITSFGFNKNILLGYSMGGRLALSYASSYSDFVSALILESASPGIIDKEERELRLLNDEKLAQSLKQTGIETFILNWINQPFFHSLKNIGNEKLLKLINEREKNDPIGIANILTEFSQGKMLPKWEKLQNFNFPVLLVSGALDKKYCEINSKVSILLKTADLKKITDCGHNVHLENAEEFINLVNSFLNKYF